MNRVPPIDHGLANLGQTCFFNVVVQALVRCDPIIREWLQPLAPEEVAWSLLGRIWLEMMRAPRSTAFCPSDLWKQTCLWTGWVPGQPQDVHECLGAMLDRLAVERPIAAASWTGQSLVTIHCDCPLVQRSESWTILNLPLVGHRLADCLTAYLKPEPLETPCATCHRSPLRVERCRPPNLLMLHVNRLLAHGAKNRQSIRWPLQLHWGRMYHLICLAVHIGSRTGGHWVLWSRGGGRSLVSSYHPEWVCLDDRQVDRPSPQKRTAALGQGSVGWYLAE